MKDMKKALLLAILSLMAASAFGAFPFEYPLYLQYLGFTKSELKDMQNGRTLTHSIQNKAPGEFGVIAGRVYNVPMYYFRDYYSYIENLRTLHEFQQVGRFGKTPSLQDLKPLQIDDTDVHDFLSCRAQDCEMKLSADEMKMIPETPDLKTDAGRNEVSNVYRTVLLSRLNAYIKDGLRGVGKYQDGANEDNPDAIFNAHILKFEYIDAYFPILKKYMVDYPNYTNKNIDDFFFWSKDYMGGKPVISIYHAFSMRIGEDYILVNKLVYSNHYYLSSIAVMHLLNYADGALPRTLFVIEQRTLTDLKGNVMDAIGRNVLRANLEKRLASRLKTEGKTMEQRYRERAYLSFPYGLQSRDQQ